MVGVEFRRQQRCAALNTESGESEDYRRDRITISSHHHSVAFAIITIHTLIIVPITPRRSPV